MKNLLKKDKKFLISILFNIAIVTAGVIFYVNKKVITEENLISRDQNEMYTLTSPILDCEDAQGNSSVVIPYEKVFEKAQSLSEKYKLTNYSLYFRDLNNGQWIGLNEKEVFSPASLMKTPLLIAFLKHVERDPELLSQKVKATDEYFKHAIKQDFGYETVIEKGKEYTLKELMEYMIISSDNVATLMVSKFVLAEDFDGVFKSVGISIDETQEDPNIRVKDFASFFRVLYNASYLNRDMSELALSILSRSKFNFGLKAGVPEDVLVAHKYGERVKIDASSGEVLKNDKQLHDCGIVYADKNPYILCMMTKGNDFTAQGKYISEISGYFYNMVAK